MRNLETKITKKCLSCQSMFTYNRYGVGSGNYRRHCTPECREKYKKLLKKKREELLPLCIVPNCGKPGTRLASGFCEKHYSRDRRTGETKDAIPMGRYVTMAGYVKLLLPGHPLSDKKGHVFEHRKELYGKYGSGQIYCHWCGIQLGWDTCKVDHLNDIKNDNRIENIVPSCNNCNRARGATSPFIKKLNKKSFRSFIRACINIRSGV